MNVVKKFKGKEEYLNYRKTMLDEAEQMINEGKIDEGNAKLEDVKELDEDFEAFAQTKANLAALSGAQPQVNLENLMGNSSVQGTVIAVTDNNNPGQDMYDSLEYRNAFMNNVIHGTPIPEKFKNSNENTKTTDVATVIPTTTMNKIIEKLETVGRIYAKVTKTAFKGGLAIPTSTVKPVASWVAEGKGSDRQKKTTGKITFNYYKLRCAISMSIETQTMALSAFEAKFVENVTTAMIKAIEQGIFTGTGSTGGQMTGFLTETVTDDKKVMITKAGKITYKDLCAAEAALPEEYENGAEWYMRKATFFNQIAAMTDSNGQPVARVNVGINGKPVYNILGRPVNFTQYMPAYADTVEADTIVACIYDMSAYVINTNLAMTVKRYEDNETDDQVTKAIMIVDGKSTENESLVEIVKKSA
ncbi:MAG: phage major capsid protein [Lachnospira sp.]|nr:phage major capsid protein [Lachnospira sp.]